MSKVNALDYAIFRSAIKGENGETLYHVRSRALVGTTDFETICKNIESNAMPKVSDVKGCTEALIEEIAYQVSQSKRAHIDGLGSFYPIDFITFLCHHIAVVEYQQVSYNFWVVLGGASKLLRTFALCIYAKSIIVQVPQVL
jgi:hypothetical protein